MPPALPVRPPLHRGPPPRGAVLPFVLVALTALIGAAALAIDLNRVQVTATEVQGVADAAALGAVSASQMDPDHAGQNGPTRAQLLASRNRAANAAGAVAAGDVAPVWYSQSAGTTTVTSYGKAVNAVVVTARARGPYALAGALGLTPPTVVRRATAWIGNMQGAACVRPLAPPYTRIYEDANGLTARPYSSQNPPQYAPTITQAQVAYYSKLPATSRTFVLIPPWQREEVIDTSSGGHPNSGSWHTVDFGSLGYAAYSTFIGAPTGSATCAAASTRVGDYLTPFTWLLKDSTTLLENARPGFMSLCNQGGVGDTTRHVATCRNADGTVGVPTRAALADSIPAPGGKFSQRVRMVTQLRVMCYFVYTTDRCPATVISDGAGHSLSWQMPSVYPGSPPVDRGYPRGTMVVLLDGPVYGDITPDVTLGDSLSLTQRLVLVP